MKNTQCTYLIVDCSSKHKYNPKLALSPLFGHGWMPPKTCFFALVTSNNYRCYTMAGIFQPVNSSESCWITCHVLLCCAYIFDAIWVGAIEFIIVLRVALLALDNWENHIIWHLHKPTFLYKTLKIVYEGCHLSTFGHILNLHCYFFCYARRFCVLKLYCYSFVKLDDCVFPLSVRIVVNVTAHAKGALSIPCWWIVPPQPAHYPISVCGQETYNTLRNYVHFKGHIEQCSVCMIWLSESSLSSKKVVRNGNYWCELTQNGHGNYFVVTGWT